MPILLLLFLGLVCLGCQDKRQEDKTGQLRRAGLREVKIQLENGFGEATLAVPLALDTNYKWHQQADVTCDVRTMHTVASRYFPHYTGGFVLPDSVYEFSVSHTAIASCMEKAARPDTELLQQLDQWLTFEQQEAARKEQPWKRAEIKEVNGRRFLFLMRLSTHEAKELLFMRAITISNGNPVYFEYLYRNRHSENMIEPLLASLQTIQLSN